MADTDTFSNGFNAGIRKSGGRSQGSSKKMKKPVDTITTSDGQSLTPSAPLKSFKKGGRVRKTGVYRLHKGEEVVPAKKAGKKSRRKASSKR